MVLIGLVDDRLRTLLDETIKIYLKVTNHDQNGATSRSDVVRDLCKDQKLSHICSKSVHILSHDGWCLEELVETVACEE